VQVDVPGTKTIAPALDTLKQLESIASVRLVELGTA